MNKKCTILKIIVIKIDSITSLIRTQGIVKEAELVKTYE